MQERGAIVSEDPSLIDDVYQIRSPISRGNKTMIYEVLEQGTGRHLAMKLVVDGKPEDKKAAVSELKAEAAVAKNLNHPNIIGYEGFSTSRDATYMLMEYFRAANVKAQIKSELPGLHSRARPLLEGVCQALMHLHELGWVHLDLKPENILLNRSGEAKLIDFSLAVKFSQGIGKMLGLGGKSKIQGTRTYIAPEIILRKAPSPQTDIYSLGVTFFEILAGKTPFQGFTPQDLLEKHLRLPPPLASAYNPNVTPEMDQLLLAMLAKKPKDRPGSMQEVYSEIHRLKLFHQDVLEIQAAKMQQEHADKMSLMTKLDSRTDAERSDLLRADPTLAQQHEDERKAREDRRKPKVRLNPKDTAKAEAAKSAAAAAPVQQQPQMPGMNPMMMLPGMMQPGMMQYPMMMPQPMMPPGMMQQPMMMPQPMMPPFASQPGYQQPPGYPPAGYAQPSYPPSPVMPAPAPIAPTPIPLPVAPAAPPLVVPDALEYMTELPDVL